MSEESLVGRKVRFKKDTTELTVFGDTEWFGARIILLGYDGGGYFSLGYDSLKHNYTLVPETFQVGDMVRWPPNGNPYRITLTLEAAGEQWVSFSDPEDEDFLDFYKASKLEKVK